MQDARRILGLEDKQDRLALIGEIIALLDAIREKGPWQQHDGQAYCYYLCHYCDCDKGDPHEKDCLWLEVETGSISY